MTGMPIAAVIARTPADMISPDGGLANYGATNQGVVEGQRFGNAFGLRCHAPMSWSPIAFANLIRHSPVMVDMLWLPDEYVQQHNSPGHMVVVSGAISDNRLSGGATYVKVLDPWPQGKGKVCWFNYNRWMMGLTTRTYRVWTR